MILVEWNILWENFKLNLDGGATNNGILKENLILIKEKFISQNLVEAGIF